MQVHTSISRARGAASSALVLGVLVAAVVASVAMLGTPTADGQPIAAAAAITPTTTATATVTPTPAGNQCPPQPWSATLTSTEIDTNRFELELTFSGLGLPQGGFYRVADNAPIATFPSNLFAPPPGITVVSLTGNSGTGPFVLTIDITEDVTVRATGTGEVCDNGVWAFRSFTSNNVTLTTSTTPTPTPTSTATPPATATPTNPTPTPTGPTATPTPTPTPTPTITATPTVIPTSTPDHAASGVISGAVVAAEDPTVGLQGIIVCASSFVSGATCDTSAGDGTYSIGDLSTSNYLVTFVDPSATRLTRCYLDDDCDAPTPVGVISPGSRTGINGALPLASDPDPTPTTVSSPTAEPTATLTPTPTPDGPSGAASISGTITELRSEMPIFGARVCAERDLPAGSWCAFTSLDGGYVIDGLPAGNFRLMVEDLAARFLPSCWGTTTCDAADTVGVSAAQPATGIDVALDPLYAAGIPTPMPSPEGSVQGTVFNDGSPLAGADVCAVHPLSGAQRCAVTDDDGVYIITGLATGNYRIEVGDGVHCYLDHIGCDAWTPVGIVSPFGRTSINIAS